MSAEIWLVSGEEARRKVHEPFAGSDHALIAGACPACGHVEQAPEGHGARGDVFKGAGRGRRIAADDRSYEADAIALCCRQRVGTFRAVISTLFGLREDEAVLVHGRCRVY